MIKIPNWAFGCVSVKGKPKDIENFCKLFVFEEDENKDNISRKYFARSFAQTDWKSFKKNNLGTNEANFTIKFAWSCWSCLFEGYPNGNECVTLEWAMYKYNVEVKIETEEGGEGFEEIITTENGKPIYSSKDMPTYECQKCGNKQVMPSDCDLEDEECCECGEYGNWEDKLEELIKKKLENGRR